MTSVATMEPLTQRNVGEIAANLAGATSVFRRFGIDFCCHGDVPLDEAAQSRGVDIRALEDALGELDATQALPPAQDTAAMIDHIVARYHEVHRRQLPELILLARKVEQVHAAKSGVPAGLADILQHSTFDNEELTRERAVVIQEIGQSFDTPDDLVFDHFQ